MHKTLLTYCLLYLLYRFLVEHQLTRKLNRIDQLNRSNSKFENVVPIETEKGK